MELTEEDLQIQAAALNFARKNKKRIAKEIADTSIYPREEFPVSVFMAGSPGAGKTEIAKAIISSLANNGDKVLRIDADELRVKFDAYNGSNSHLFQAATSILVEKLHDIALDRKQSFILDGTLTNYAKAKHNILRSIGKKRPVAILYVYQEPKQAWEFVQAREAVEGRRIQPETFVDQYFAAREVVNALKQEFGDSISVDLMIKDIDGTNRGYKANVDAIDNHLPEKYDRAAIMKITESDIGDLKC